MDHQKYMRSLLEKGKEFFSGNSKNISRPRAAWLAIAVVFGGWLTYVSPWIVESQERQLFDVLQKYNRNAEDRYSTACIVAGERTRRSMQWPPLRSDVARLVGNLQMARLVVLNDPFSSASDEWEDNALVDAVRQHGRVLGQSRFYHILNSATLQEPFPALRRVFKSIGLSNRAEDPDGICRQGLWGQSLPGSQLIPSLSLAILREVSGHRIELERDGTEVRLPWKTMQLLRSDEGRLSFWINEPQRRIPVYEYVDVLENRLPPSTFVNVIVVVSSGESAIPENVTVSGNSVIPQAEYILRSFASLAGPFAPWRLPPVFSALLTSLMVFACAAVGFVHFKKSLAFLLLFFVLWGAISAVLFLSAGLWLPVAGPLWACLAGYLGSQIVLSWRLYHDWNVRSLSIRPLLTLARRAESELADMSFDDYLRSLWNEIEQKTGVELKSTRVDENVSLVQSYLQRASETDQQGHENFMIIRDAADTAPRHRMLLPLPLWGESGRPQSREYVILGWDGRIPMETLNSLAALTLFASVHFHGLEESRRRREMLFKTIEAIMMAVEAKDPTTSHHSRRVAALSKRLAQWLKLSPQEIDDIYFSAIIHDIGKLGVSDIILKKPSMLTDAEVLEMQRHPLIGGDIMRPVELPEYVMSGILQHHERHDGKGYPFGLKGEQMTMAGKIIKVADVFDALMNRRQYKEPWTEAKVRAFLTERRGTEFDPQVVDVFLKHISDTHQNPLLYYGITF